MTCYKDLILLRNDYLNSSSLTEHEFSLLYKHVTGVHFNPVDAKCTNDYYTEKLVRLLDRRKKGEPIQYIIGSWPFLDFEVKVDNRALIPRPETELLALEAISIIKHNGFQTVIDLCSGSGIIGLAIQKNISKCHVTAVEISHSACLLMEDNRKFLNASINIVEDDALAYLEKLKDDSIDLIVSNPPYVAKSEYDKNYLELQYEPSLAFIASENGYYFYNHLSPLCHKKLKHGGFLLYEIGDDQKTQVFQFLEKNHFIDLECKKDYNGIDRVVLAKKD